MAQLKPQYTRHSHAGPRTFPVYFYVEPEELAEIERLRTLFADIPISRSLLMRVALAVLRRVVSTGYVPEISEKLMKRRPEQRHMEAASRGKAAPFGDLKINFASLAKAAARQSEAADAG